jgi:hypothetical protein
VRNEENKYSREKYRERKRLRARFLPEAEARTLKAVLADEV